MAVVVNDGYLLHVGAEDAVGDTVGMADVMTKRRSLTADFTYLRHFNHSITYTVCSQVSLFATKL